MKKTIIKTCICFLDAAVWFTTTDYYFPPWVYDMDCLKILYKEDIFVIGESSHISCLDEAFLYTNIIISCCKKCVNFQANYEHATSEFLNKIHCLFVKDDMTVFDDGFNQKIYIQSDRSFERRKNDKEIFEIELPRNLPQTKSCFTSSACFNYNDFCSKCKAAFTQYLVGDLLIFSRTNTTPSE